MPMSNAEIVNAIAREIQSSMQNMSTQRMIEILTMLRSRITTRIDALELALAQEPAMTPRAPEVIRAQIEAREQDELLTSPLADHAVDAARYHQQMSLHVEVNTARWAIGWPQRQHFGLD